eukprot:11801589-Alexandrium_andersonii.AAC.1
MGSAPARCSLPQHTAAPQLHLPQPVTLSQCWWRQSHSRPHTTWIGARTLWTARSHHDRMGSTSVSDTVGCVASSLDVGFSVWAPQQ